MKKRQIEKKMGEIPTELIDTKEVAKRLKISAKSVINHKNKGVIPFVRVGRSIRYAWDEVYRCYHGQSAA